MFQQHLDNLTLIGDEIQNLIRNYKKDSPSRKTNIPYFQDRLDRLTELWKDFERNDDELRSMRDVPSNHEYFQYYIKIKDVVEEFTSEFQNRIITISQTNISGDAATEQKNRMEGASGSNSSASSNKNKNNMPITHGLVRKLDAKILALERILASVTINAGNQPRQYFKIKGDLIHQNWQQIEALFELIWEQHGDPVTIGVNMDKYLDLESRSQQQIIELSIRSEQDSNDALTAAAITQALPLPKLTIPKFDGDYLKWSQFFDLFSHIVDKQQLPNVQKMYYLKSNLSGEADRLISHLAVTEENYTSAWSLLQERYNNKRVLASTLVQKILNQPPSVGTATSIKKLHDTTRECLLALNNLGVDTNSWDVLLIQLLIKKLDRNTHMRYEQSITHPKDLQSVKDLLSFLQTHFHSMEAFDAKDKSIVHSTAKSCTSILTSNKINTNCKCCNNGTHPLFTCKQFLSLTPSERLKHVQKHKLCINCMKTGHISSQCSSRNCSKCDRKHNTLLHLSTKTSNQNTPTEENIASTLTTSALKRGYVVLGTVKVKIATGYGSFLTCRAILDSGSQINLITETLVKKLKLQINIAPISIEGIGQRKKGCKGYTDITVKSLVNAYNANIEVFVIPKIVSQQPIQEIDTSEWQIPSDIMLADPEFYKPGEIDLLMGAELYHSLLKEGQLQLSNGVPIFQNTVFGWMCCGKIKNMVHSNLTCGIYSEDDELLNSSITKFWELDNIQPTNPSLTAAESRGEEYFHQTTVRNNEGRFVVRIPFNTGCSSLDESLQVTTNRFYHLEQRLLKQPQIRDMNIQFMREYEKLGHMKRLTITKPTKPYYAIPHHCVLKPDSTTTKLRVVFDLAKTSSGVSLNDIMYKGPIVQSQLMSILLRFRKHRFVFTTDIEKMYRQILLHPDDQNFQIINCLARKYK